MEESKLLTAANVAAICQVDPKTIHNWCDQNNMPHFRTPGRHLRFDAAKVVPWLAKFGYPIPVELRGYVSKIGADNSIQKHGDDSGDH